MKSATQLLCLAALLTLGACAGAPPARYVTLEDDRAPQAGTGTTPAIAVVRANVPELIDRPQLVLRQDHNHVVLSDQYRWAEPLRREIPRLIAQDLGEMLNSRRVAAVLPDDAGFPIDYRLTLEVQQLDAVVGLGVDVDVLWRLEARNGKSLTGRSTFRQPLAGAPEDQLALVTAQRQALRRVAGEIGEALGGAGKR